jgi:outer membrane protein
MLRFRLLSVLAVCAATLASVSTAAAQAKVGVVNFQKALLDTADAKKAQVDLNAEFKSRQDELDKVQRELQDDQTILQTSQGKLTPQKEAEVSANIQHNQHLAERLQQDLQDDFQKRQTEIVQRLGTRMTEIVSKLRDEKGLDAVLDTAATIAYNKTLDFTAEATAAYDKAYPVAGAAASAPK